MDEEKLKKQLIRITIITILISLLLSVVGFGIWTFMVKSAHDAEHSQMEVETEEYKIRLIKQIDKNMQILTTLAKAYEVSAITKEDKQLEKSLIATNSANDFISMTYMPKEGVGIMYTPDFGIWSNIKMEDCHPFAAEAIEAAMQGKNVVSELFESEIYNEKMFVYAVPVYYDGELIGVLSASDTIEIFTDITDGKAVMSGAGYIHIINTDGEFLVRSQNTLVTEEMRTIYDGTILAEKTKQKIHSALQKGDTAEGQFVYRKEKCHFYMMPLGINGWYLFCVNKLGEGSLFAGNILKVFDTIMLLFVILMNVLLYMGRQVFSKNTKALIKIAYIDSVTGAENIVRFDQKFDQITNDTKNFSTIALNIHNFKGINDLFGKAQGNLVLCYLKKIIENNLKKGEFFCRGTADLFYILMFEIKEEQISRRLREIIDHVSEASITYDKYSYDLSLYAGVAIGEDREKALIAMQSIQHTHHTDIAFYNYNMHQEIRRRNSIESQMYPALQNKEFKLFLQPKFNLKNDELIGAEALVRWQNPDGSYRYPGEFIPLFEKNGFCLKLDMYMIEQACEQIRAWIDAGITPIPISVNQSKLLFSDLKYPHNLMQILNRYQIPASLITLEILESIAVNNTGFINHQIDVLHNMGFRISMDDFGSGYSSLNMLYQINIDELKLDRNFLRKVSKEDEKRRQIILEQIISFAQRLDIATVAEGIETQDDKEFVLKLNCDFGQGYFYDKPIDANEFTQRYMST